ncbi:MAG: hypothetical protein FWG30_07495 [Eubacteriaceae bacterium]|nr:hypothetical protein [Eubacteriaceae bacterium]
MKKALIAVLLACCFLASCSSSPKTQDTPGTRGENLVDWLQAGTYSYDFTMQTTGGGESFEMSGSVFAKGGSYLMQMQGTPIAMKVLIKGDEAYMINDEAKTAISMSLGSIGVDMSVAMSDMPKASAVSSGEAELDGKKYKYEEYDTGNGIGRFYYDGNSVIAIETNSGDDASMIMKISNTSNTVDSSLFEIPSDYTISSFNLSDLLNTDALDELNNLLDSYSE